MTAGFTFVTGLTQTSVSLPLSTGNGGTGQSSLPLTVANGGTGLATSPLTAILGGTGQIANPTDGQILIGGTSNNSFIVGTPATDSRVIYTGASGAGTWSAPNLSTMLLGKLISANMATTNDQAITMAPNITGSVKYIIRRITFTNASATPVLAAGSVYTAASKGGTASWATSQVFTTLISATVILEPTMVAAYLTGTLTSTQLYLSLSTINATALTCDVYVWGDQLA